MSDFRFLFNLLIISSLSTPLFAVKRDKPIPLSLDAYVKLALKKSLRIQSAEENLMSSKWSWDATRRNLTWPTLTASGNTSKSFSDTDTGSETDTDSKSGTLSLSQPFLTGTDVSVSGTWTDTESETESSGVTTKSLTKNEPSINASVSQPLYVFMKNDKLRTRKRAQLSWENAQDSYRNEQLNIEFSARTIYYNLLFNRERVKVERKKYESAKLVHKITKALVRAGKKAQVESLRADISAKQDLRRIENVENTFQQDLNEAKDFILYPTDTPIKLVTDLGYVPFKIGLQKLIRIGVEKNPSLNNSRRNVELSRINLRQTKEGNRPDLDLSGTYSKTLNRSNPSAPIDPFSWTVQLGASWAFFDATQTKLSVLQSEVSLRNSERSLETQERQLKVDIENAYLDVKRTEEQIKEFGVQKKSARRSLRATRLQYRNGIARLTDVFDAENQLRDLDLEYLGLLVEFNTARDRLSLLIGTDVNQLESGQ